MKVAYFIFILLNGCFFMSCNQQTEDQQEGIQVEYLTSVSEEDSIEPPPPGFTSNFKTVEEWLFNICDTDKPEKPITTYNFGLFESPDGDILFLVGTNKYEEGEGYSATRIEFEPANRYFPLPKINYGNGERQQVLEQLTAQLKEFTNTDTFKRSFLAEAQSITTDFSGIIWTK